MKLTQTEALCPSTFFSRHVNTEKKTIATLAAMAFQGESKQIKI